MLSPRQQSMAEGRMLFVVDESLGRDRTRIAPSWNCATRRADRFQREAAVRRTPMCQGRWLRSRLAGSHQGRVLPEVSRTGIWDAQRLDHDRCFGSRLGGSRRWRRLPLVSNWLYPAAGKEVRQQREKRRENDITTGRIPSQAMLYSRGRRSAGDANLVRTEPFNVTLPGLCEAVAAHI